MKTLECSAELYDQRNSSEWREENARQGRYTTTLHRGLIVFPQLAEGAMKGKNILDIKLKFAALGAGYGYTKDLNLHKTAKTAPGGTYTGWIGEKLGKVNDKFYNATIIIGSLAQENPALFSRMKGYFEEGGQALAIYANEGLASDRDYSRNYLSLSQVVMTISYEYGSSIYRHNGSEWINCVPYYHDGSKWVQCQAWRHDGSQWKR